MIRRRQVKALTGWGDKYIAKLVRDGVLETWRPHPRAQHWYFSEQIEQFLTATTKKDA